jgi:spore coat polysaccharide biosynthesis protein SpsF (cytidylyltransferase family)
VPAEGGAERVLAIVQARMSSTRLPGKSLADVCGEPMLALVLRRLQRSSAVERIVVATTTDPIDDEVEDVVRGLGFDVYRGSRDDVLGRFAGAATDHRGPLARVTADCPFIDPAIVDQVIDLFRRTAACVYASNIEPRTYPDGLDIEVVSADVLREVAATAIEPEDREHVTAAIRREPLTYPSAALVCDEQLGGLRWTVDTKEDLEFVRQVVTRLGPRRHSAGMREILAAVRDEPSLADYHGRRG